MILIRKVAFVIVILLLTAASIGGGAVLAWRAVLYAAESRLEIGSLPSRNALQQTPAPRPPMPPRSPAADAPQPPPLPPGTIQVEEGVQIRRVGRPVFRLGRDYLLPAGEAVREVVVIGGTATIEGEVETQLVVIAGRAELGRTAVIRGDMTVVGGALTVQPGADVRRDLVVVGAGFDAPPSFSAGGEHVILGDFILGNRINALVPWITGGLIWGRPLVLSVGWLWGAVAIFLFLYFVIALVFDAPVRATVDTLRKRPIGAFMTGLLVLLLLGPVVFLLAVSVVGIIVIPFLIFALVLAWLMGKVAVLRWIGASVVAEDEPDQKLQAIRSFLIGFAIITAIYLVPILGMLTWGTLSVWGLGTACLTLMAALRKENPNGSKRRPVAPPVPPPMPPTPPMSSTPLGEPQYPGHAAYAAPATRTAETGFGSEPAVTSPPVERPHEPVSPGDSRPFDYGQAAAVPLSSHELLAMPRATFLDRAAAFGLDVILVLFVVGFFTPRWFIRDGPEPFFFVLFLYHVAFWLNKSSTVGGLICNLRVIRTDGSRLQLGDAILRGLAGIFSLVVVGLGALWILKDPERQAWHDRIAGTYVVKVPRSYPIR
jgi:uncharacterized RDD family membrane protein YckC